MIETQILPRLLAARRRAYLPLTSFGGRGRWDIETFAHALIDPESDAAFVFLSACRAVGADDVTLMIEVLAPAARRLGEMWEQDVCDFLQVADGLARLEAMLAGLGHDNELLISAAAPSLLLMTAPGETHFLGADMAAELFRREGWDAERTGPEGLRLIASRRFDAIGVSISAERLLPGLLELMEAARKAAAPRKPAFLIGGALFASDAPFALEGKNAREFKADFLAGDAAATLRVSGALLVRRCS